MNENNVKVDGSDSGEDEDDDEGIFEVDYLMDSKLVRGKRYFYVSCLLTNSINLYF